VTAAEYQVVVEGPSGRSLLHELTAAVRDFRESVEVMITEERRGVVRTTDVKAYVEDIESLATDSGCGEDEAAQAAGAPAPAEEARRSRAVLRFRIAVTPRGSVRPETVVAAFAGVARLPLDIISIERLRILLG
jgi:hypothetical protein